MKSVQLLLVCAVLLFALAACSQEQSAAPEPDAPENEPAADGVQADPVAYPAGEERTETFSDATQLVVTGHLQHIVLTPAAGDELVLRWTGEGDETLTHDGGTVRLAFAEPNWRDPARNGTSPRFSVVSTVYVELPTGMDGATLTSTLGDIRIDGVSGYGELVAETVNGDVTADGVSGKVEAASLEGDILPESLAADIMEREYSDTHNSKHLTTVLPGADAHAQRTVLYTVLGSVRINMGPTDASGRTAEPVALAAAGDDYDEMFTDLNQAVFTTWEAEGYQDGDNYFRRARIDVVDADGYDHQAVIFVCQGSDEFTKAYHEYLNGLLALYGEEMGEIVGYRNAAVRGDRTYRTMEIDFFCVQAVSFTDRDGILREGVLVALDGEALAEEEAELYSVFHDYYVKGA